MRAPRWVRCGAAAALAWCALILMTGTVGAASSDAAQSHPPALGRVVIPDLGPGYAVTSQGPLDASQFASDTPDPSAAAGALASLGTTISTYERVWQADGGLNQVQDLLVHFPDAVVAQVFLQAAQHALESGEIVSSDPLASIPGARRVTYFAATDRSGVGEAITMRAGVYVALLSFFSAATGNAQPISPADAERVAQAQYTTMRQAPGGVAGTTTVAGTKKGVSGSAIALTVVVVAVLALAVATPALLRRRRAGPDDGPDAAPATAPETEPATVLPTVPSGGDAIHDLRQHGG